jgi:tetratricopeptide (TPR) repeat protein
MNPAKRNQKLEESRQAFQAGDVAGAVRICQAILRTNKADTQAMHTLAVIASSQGDDSTAVAQLSRCVAIAPGNASFHNDLARVHALAGRYGPALASLRRALQLQPGDVRALTDLADILERSGQQHSASEVLAPLVAKGQVGADMALVRMRLLDHAGHTAQAVDLAKGLLAGAPMDASTQRFLLQQLGRLHETMGDCGDAFAAFSRAKQIERQALGAAAFVPADYARDIDALIQAFSKPALARLPRSTLDSALPVFIACMPRSGSTLVEQVIHAHPQAHGAGETTLLHKAVVKMPADLGVAVPYPHCIAALDQAAADALASSYLLALRNLAPTAQRITNKHLLNYLHLCMVALLFPGARVIHIRRNRLDNGLACFMTSLSPAVMPWATDLRDIGFAWRQYERLMAHWRDTLGLQMLELEYEELVDNSEAQIRRIVDFCGLPWDERCLRFWEAERVVLTPSYDQVRRPIFRTALDRWRKYEAFLGPLQEALG